MSFSSSSSVPIDMLPGIGHRTAKVLRQMHIRTIGEFKQVPEKILVELFGPSILRLYQYVQATKQPKQHQQVEIEYWHISGAGDRQQHTTQVDILGMTDQQIDTYCHSQHTKMSYPINTILGATLLDTSYAYQATLL